MARRQQAAGIGVGAGLLVVAVGFRGFNALTERQFAMATIASTRSELMTVDGRNSMSEESVPLDEAVRVMRPLLMRPRRTGPVWVAVELPRGAKPQLVLGVLQRAHLARQSVELVGQGPKSHLVAPPVFAAAVAVVSDPQLVAPVRVLFVDEVCERCVGVASLTDAGLQVKGPAGEQGWKLEEVPRFGDVDGLPGVEFVWSTSTEALVRAALIALSHQHVLVARVPPPEPLPD